MGATSRSPRRPRPEAPRRGAQEGGELDELDEFDLLLEGFVPDAARDPADELARMFRIDRAHARAIVASLPRIVKRRISGRDVPRYEQAMTALGARFELRRSPIKPMPIVPVSGVATSPLPEAATLLPSLPPRAPSSSPPAATPLTSSPAWVDAPAAPSERVWLSESDRDALREPISTSPSTLHLGTTSEQGVLFRALPTQRLGHFNVLTIRTAIAGSFAPPKTPLTPLAPLTPAALPMADEPSSLPAPSPRPSDPSPQRGGAHAVDQALLDACTPRARAQLEADIHADIPADIPAPMADRAEPAVSRSTPSSRPPERRRGPAGPLSPSHPQARPRDFFRAISEACFDEGASDRYMARLFVGVCVFVVLINGRACRTWDSDVDEATAGWGVPLEGDVLAGDAVYVDSPDDALRISRWATSSFHRFANNDPERTLALAHDLERAGATGVYAAEIKSAGLVRIAMALRVELPDDPQLRRAIFNVMVGQDRAKEIFELLVPERTLSEVDPFADATSTMVPLLL